MLRLTRRAAIVCAAALALAVGVSGCSGDPPFDRDGAVRRVVEQGEGAFSEAQAGCYVDRVVNDLGAAVLAPDARPNPGQLNRLTVIRLDCAGATSIGRSLGSSTIAPLGTLPSGRVEALHYGEDIQLDLLWDACEAGDGAACDALFDRAPVGSDYEEFAYTCGHRSRELGCFERYGSPTTAPAGPAATGSPAPGAR